MLLKSPKEYSYHELLELSDEAVTCYVKKIPDKTKYDIATAPIIFLDDIDNSYTEAYHRLLLNSQDFKTLTSFISDFNQLISSINKHPKSRDLEEINNIGNIKKHFFRTWMSLTRHSKFDNSSVQKWFESVLDKIEKSKIIDIYNVNIFYKCLEIRPNINMCALWDYPQQNIHYYNINENDEDDKADPPQK